MGWKICHQKCRQHLVISDVKYTNRIWLQQSSIRTEDLDVILETRFNLVFTHSVSAFPNRARTSPNHLRSRSPQISQIMHFGHILFTRPRQTIFLLSPLTKSGSNSARPISEAEYLDLNTWMGSVFFFLELELTSPIQITVLLLASWKKIMPVLLMIMMAFFPCGTHE